jgi:putative addiction module component (TIGR02574 family)
MCQQSNFRRTGRSAGEAGEGVTIMSNDWSLLMGLPPEQRLQLVEALWDSLAADASAIPVHEWQKEELDRREAEHLRDPGSAISWEEAKERIRKGNG